MNKDYSDITLLVDRSGSMATCKADMDAGIRFFVDEQKKQTGITKLTLCQFDHTYEEVFTGVPIQHVAPYSLEPRGSTALLDSLGKAILNTGKRLAALKEEERPGLVVFVIVTDGQENASREFTKAKIKEMIEHQQTVYNWKFTFLGADQDAFAEASAIGLDVSTAANYVKGNEQKTWGAALGNVTRMKSATMRGLEAQSYYTDEERKEMTTK